MKPIKLQRMKRTNFYTPVRRVWFQKNDDEPKKEHIIYLDESQRPKEKNSDFIEAQRADESRIKEENRVFKEKMNAIKQSKEQLHVVGTEGGWKGRHFHGNQAASYSRGQHNRDYQRYGIRR